MWRRRLREQRDACRDDGIELEPPVTAERADHEAAVVVRDLVELRETVDVDERCRPGEAQVHQRNQALPAGDHSGLRLRDGFERFLHRRGADVVERRRLHDVDDPGARPPATPARTNFVITRSCGTRARRPTG